MHGLIIEAPWLWRIDLSPISVIVVGDASVSTLAQGKRLNGWDYRAMCAYPNHVHGADEVYVVLAGSGEWSLENRVYERKSAGYVIEVPSMTVHALRTRAAPVLMLWSWTGDLTLERYRFV